VQHGYFSPSVIVFVRNKTESLIRQQCVHSMHSGEEQRKKQQIGKTENNIPASSPYPLLIKMTCIFNFCEAKNSGACIILC